MTALIFDAYAGSAPNGASIGTFTEARDKTITVHHNDFGEGSLVINRHSSEVALAATGNYIRARLGAGAPFGAFWLEEGRDAMIRAEEEGAEDQQRGGRGPLAYLERAILWPTRSATGPGVITEGTWSWTDQTIGAILDDVLTDATTRGAIPLVTWDFGGSNDSGSNAWDTVDDTFELSVGMDYLEIFSRFQSAGVTIRMSHDFTLSAWNDPPGADVSGSVSFAHGTNIREAADRQVYASPAKSRVVVQGTTKAGVPKFREVTDATLETAIGRREGYASYPEVVSNNHLDRAGRQYIKALKRQKDGPSIIGVLNTPVPFTAYQAGDTVNVDIPGSIDNENLELATITVSDDEADSYLTSVGFEDAPFDPLAGVKTGSTSSDSSGGGIGGGGTGGGGGHGCGGGCGGSGNGCCPPWDGTGTPTTNQKVSNEFVANGDGTTTGWTTDYPYITASLRVWVDGVNVTSEKTETNNTTGAFSLSFAPVTGETIRASYYAL